MIRLYKEDAECNCSPEQVEQMTEAGWSTEKKQEEVKTVTPKKSTNKKPQGE